MTDFEKIELACKAAELYAEFQEYCHGKSCVGCVFRPTKICEVYGAQEFVLMLGMYLKSINYKAILKNLKPGD